MLSQMEGRFDQAVGIDMSQEALRFGKRFTKAKLAIANAEKLPLRTSTFDYIISTDAFEHIPDDTTAIQEVKRVLRPGGCFIIYVPCQQGILSNTRFVHLFHTSQTSYLLDQRYYTISSLTRLVESAGLRVEYVSYHNIFMQEFFTQILKWLASQSGKKYEHQADIEGFLDIRFFPVYRWVLLPVISFLVRTEELICENVFKAHIPGHRILMKCTYVNSS